MDNDELASHFAEKLKWEEQEHLYKEKIASIEEELKLYKDFISLLRLQHYFFGGKYRNAIDNFQRIKNLL